ncbi:MAG: hypothetical protein IJB09_01800 [Oscillospiraceae bacterium]|nr:hypothetical protein [Oscillospiraceae bacterium]
MEYIVIFLLISSGSIAGAVFWNKSYGEMLPFTCCSLALVLFVFGLLGILKAGIYFLLFSALAVYLLCLVRIIRFRTYGKTAQLLFSPGFFMFLAVFVSLLYVNIGRNVYEWDELSHWALVVKSMAEYDALGSAASSGVLFKSYPPIMALFQYLFVRLSQLQGSPVFSDWLLYFAYQVFALSFIFPFFTKARIKSLFSSLLLFLSICLVPMLLFSEFYCSLYIDAFLGIVAACGWGMLFWSGEEESFSLYSLAFLCLCSAVLVLAKDVGLVLACFLAAGCLVRILLCPRKTAAFSPIPRPLLCAAPLLSVALPKLLWSRHLDIFQVSRSFSNPVDFGVLWNVLLGKDSSYKRDVLLSYFKIWSEERLSLGEFELELSYGLMFFLLPAALIFALHLLSGTQPEKRGETRVLAALVLIQHLVYAAGLCIIYMFKFSEYEALRLASFERYISTLFLLELLLLFVVTARLLSRLTWKAPLILLIVTLAFSPLGTMRSLASGLNKYISIERSMLYGLCSDRILEEVSEGERIFLVAQEDSGHEYLLFKYRLFPHVSEQSTGWSLDPGFTEGGISPENISAAQLWELLEEQYDYVFVYRSNEYFHSTYGQLFDEPEKLSDLSFFRVDREQGTLTHVFSF